MLTNRVYGDSAYTRLNETKVRTNFTSLAIFRGGLNSYEFLKSFSRLASLLINEFISGEKNSLLHSRSKCAIAFGNSRLSVSKL